MFCEKCGNKVQEGERFCSVCGNRIENPENREKTPDIMEGMGYGYKQPYTSEQNRQVRQEYQQQPYRYRNEPVKTPKRKQEDDDFEEEWKEEAKKEKVTFVILGIIIVALVIAIVAGVIVLMKSNNGQEEKRVPQLSEEQKVELNHGKADAAGDELTAKEPEAAAEKEAPFEKEEPVEQEQPEEKVKQADEVSEAREGLAGRVIPEEVQKPETPKASVQEKAPVQNQDTVVVDDASDFIIPDSSTRYLTNSDLSSLSEWEIRVARNEIYARHGRIFNSRDLADYFAEKEWYVGSVAPEAFDNSYLSTIELENLKFILDYEKAHNLNQ